MKAIHEEEYDVTFDYEDIELESSVSVLAASPEEALAKARVYIDVDEEQSGTWSVKRNES